MAYLRFVVESIDGDSQVRQGIVQAAHALRDSADTPSDDRLALELELGWLRENLPEPTRFNRTRSKGHYRRRAAGISWLRDDAHECLARLRAICGVLERHGQRVTMLVEARPGYVVYEDRYQIVAEPFADTRR